MIEFLLSIPICILIANLVHELSHLFFAYFVDDIKPKGLYPYWHWAKFTGTGIERRAWRPWELFKKPEGYDVFYFAAYEVQGPLPSGMYEPVHVAPVIAGASAIVTVGVYFLLNGGIFPAVLVVAFALDMCVWFRGYFSGGPETDGHRYKNGMEYETLPSSNG